MTYVYTAIMIVIAACIAYLIQEMVIYIYRSVKYGSNYVRFYYKADITKFKMFGHTIKRNSRIKFYVRERKEWYEGRVIGLTTDGFILIRNNNDDIVGYKKDELSYNEFVYIG